MINYGFSKKVDMEFEEAIRVVKEALKNEGFGVLTEVDIKEKLEEKLGIDFMKYEIIGACNPPMALKAISAEENIGLMLPCNVIVYESEGETNVSIIKPTAAMSMIDNEGLEEVAPEVEEKLEKVFKSI